MAELEVKS